MKKQKHPWFCLSAQIEWHTRRKSGALTFEPVSHDEDCSVWNDMVFCACRTIRLKDERVHKYNVEYEQVADESNSIGDPKAHIPTSSRTLSS